MALSWLVYELTGSALMLGVVAFSREIAISLLAPLAGLAADRLNRRAALFITQILAMAQSLVLAFLVYWGVITIKHIIIPGLVKE